MTRVGTQGVTLVVHGKAAPPAAVVDALERAVATRAPSVEVRTSWVANASATNPLTALDAHLRAAAHPLLVVVAIDPAGRHAPIDGILEALVTRGGLVVARHDGDASQRCELLSADRYLERLAEAGAAASTRPWPTMTCAAWAIERSSYASLGGLDTSLWAIGEVDDLVRRALADGLAVEFVEAAAAIGEAYGLTDATTRYLGIRNTVVSAALHGDAAQRGRAVATIAAHALADAWAACGVDPATLRFGGAWARQRTLDRWLATPGLHQGDALWPRDVDGAMRPVMALDAALSTLVTRRGDVRRERTPAEPVAAQQASAPDVTTAPAPEGPSTSVTAAVTPAAVALVSVIIVNWNGREHLAPLFTSLRASDYPRDRLELICVDNGSHDGSRDLIAADFPEVRVVALPENRGFTGGNIAGVEAAHGDILVFLNNDMRVEPDAVRRLVEAIDDDHPCTAACVLSWDGTRIDFLRGTASWEARGFQEHYGAPRTTIPTLDTDATFCPNGGAFAITRDMYARAGGFDAAFFAYYDDLDLGWGVRVAGGHIRVVRDAIVYRRHGATSAGQPQGQKRFLLERNAVWTMVKRYGDAALARVLGPALLLAVRRFVHDASWSASQDAAGVPGPIGLRRAPLESLAALGEAVRGMPTMIPSRRRLEAARRVPDSQVLSRLGRALEALSSRTAYQAAQEAMVDVFDLAPALRARSRVLLLTHDPLRTSMAGPGVRVLELGRALAASGASVTVASPFESDLRETTFTVARYQAGNDASVSELAALHDVVVIQGFALELYPSLATMPLALVADLYCPFTIENLEMRSAALAAEPSPSAQAQFASEAASALQAQNRQLALGDFFLCASERQRDFWLGALQTAGRLTLQTYGDDPSLRSLIDVVPFGLPDTPPPPKRAHVMKGVFPGIRVTDRVLLWAGSILDWQDPQLLIRAVARLSETRDDVKLVFMGTRHPNPDVPAMRAVPASRTLADALGVLDRHVFFNEWVPYAERHEWLLEADLGVSTHREHLETHFSFRTRMLDYLWTGLPIVSTTGDVFAELVEGRGLGLTVPPGDEDALVSAIARMLDEPGLRARSAEAVRATAASMTWSQVAAPLIRFCTDPRQAADRRPATEAFRKRLGRQFTFTKWLKRTAVRAGVSDARIEQLKQTRLVRELMILRNRRAHARARRG